MARDTATPTAAAMLGSGEFVDTDAVIVATAAPASIVTAQRAPIGDWYGCAAFIRPAPAARRRPRSVALDAASAAAYSSAIAVVTDDTYTSVRGSEKRVAIAAVTYSIDAEEGLTRPYSPFARRNVNVTVLNVGNSPAVGLGDGLGVGVVDETLTSRVMRNSKIRNITKACGAFTRAEQFFSNAHSSGELGKLEAFINGHCFAALQ